MGIPGGLHECYNTANGLRVLVRVRVFLLSPQLYLELQNDGINVKAYNNKPPRGQDSIQPECIDNGE